MEEEEEDKKEPDENHVVLQIDSVHQTLKWEILTEGEEDEQERT